MALTMRDVVTENMPTVINENTKVNGIFETAFAEPANKNTQHVYNRLDSLPSFSNAIPGASVTPASTNESKFVANLAFTQAAINEPKAVIDQMDDPAGYWRKKEQHMTEAWLQHASTAVIYGGDSNFGDTGNADGWHQILKDIADNYDSDALVQKGGSSGSRTSIFVVKFIPEFSGILYNPKTMGANGVLNVTPMQAPGTVNQNSKSTSTGANVPSIGFWYNGYVGTYIGHRKLLAGITQIEDADNDRPDKDDMMKVLDYVNASSTDTFIYANRLGRRLISRIKDSSYYRVGTQEKNLSFRLDYFEDIPIVLDENILSTETTALD